MSRWVKRVLSNPIRGVYRRPADGAELPGEDPRHAAVWAAAYVASSFRGERPHNAAVLADHVLDDLLDHEHNS
jgi:hypothetical protein